MEVINEITNHTNFKNFLNGVGNEVYRFIKYYDKIFCYTFFILLYIFLNILLKKIPTLPINNVFDNNVFVTMFTFIQLVSSYYTTYFYT